MDTRNDESRHSKPTSRQAAVMSTTNEAAQNETTGRESYQESYIKGSLEFRKARGAKKKKGQIPNNFHTSTIIVLLFKTTLTNPLALLETSCSTACSNVAPPTWLIVTGDQRLFSCLLSFHRPFYTFMIVAKIN